MSRTSVVQCILDIPDGLGMGQTSAVKGRAARSAARPPILRHAWPRIGVGREQEASDPEQGEKKRVANRGWSRKKRRWPRKEPGKQTGESGWDANRKIQTPSKEKRSGLRIGGGAGKNGAGPEKSQVNRPANRGGTRTGSFRPRTRRGSGPRLAPPAPFDNVYI